MLELIGNTPLVELSKKINTTKTKILVKLEKFNAGGSIKDRPALYMIESAEKKGLLKKGMTIIEPTSGNTGIAIAMIGAVKGYEVFIILPESASEERKKILQAYGAKIMLSPAEKGTDGAIELAKKIQLSQPDKYYMPNQFENENNILAHYETTGKEIWEQTNGKVNYVVAGLGTGGTLMGIAKFMKEKNPKIKIIGVEPVKGQCIQGLKNLAEANMPKIFDPSKIDTIFFVNNDNAFSTARELAKKEGVLVGMSTGAIIYTALELAKELNDEKIIIVAIAPDGGERYLSTQLFI